MLDFYAHGEGQYSGLDGGAMHDPLAVAALVASEILNVGPMHVAVELTGTHTAGMTLCDGRRTHLSSSARTARRSRPRSRAEGINEHAYCAANAEVAVAVNSERFWELFLDVLTTYP